jgi:hypothetical protein
MEKELGKVVSYVFIPEANMLLLMTSDGQLTLDLSLRYFKIHIPESDTLLANACEPSHTAQSIG